MPGKRQLGIRFTEEVRQRLDALAKKYPDLPKSFLAEGALKIGLTAIERDGPRILLDDEKPRRRK